jgi:hypothetical protein
VPGQPGRRLAERLGRGDPVEGDGAQPLVVGRDGLLRALDRRVEGGNLDVATAVLDPICHAAPLTRLAARLNGGLSLAATLNRSLIASRTDPYAGTDGSTTRSGDETAEAAGHRR